MEKGWGGVCVMEEGSVMEGWGLSWRGGVGHIRGGVGCVMKKWGGVVMQGWDSVGCVMKGWVGCIMKGWVGWGAS